MKRARHGRSNTPLGLLVVATLGLLTIVVADQVYAGATSMVRTGGLSAALRGVESELAPGNGAHVPMSSTAQGPAATSPTTAGTGTTATGSVLARFAPLYMGGNSSYSSAQAIAIAQQFNDIVVQSGRLTPYLPAMKAANPSLKVVAYMNGAFDLSPGGTSYPTTWYARNATGARIQSINFGNWLMLPTGTWGAQIASNCAALIAKSHYDGCFLDTMGLGPLLPNYGTGLPVNPATKAVYTSTAWIAAQSANVKMVEAANPGALIIPNGLASGPKYFSTGGSTEPLLASSHVAMSEVWLRVARNPVGSYPSAKAWKEDVDMLTNAEANGWAVMVTTKLWVTATAAQQAAWHKFALASFLLGTGGRCGFSFSTASTDTALTTTTPWDSVGVGMPSGAYSTTAGGAYVRSFTHGLAVVNPGSTSVTVSFSRPYVNLGGQTVTSETLAPDTGDVLVG